MARELGVDPKTIRRYIRLARQQAPEEGSGDAKSLIPPAGNTPPASPVPPAGNEPAPGQVPSRGIAQRSPGRPSACEPYGDRIGEMLEKGLSAQRIYQDLKSDHGFEGGYDAVKRFARRLKKADPKRVWRMETLPGEEAQIDFGFVSCIEDASGRKRRKPVFRVILSCSRKGYTEMVDRQDTETFIRALENSFRHFGGVPRTLCPDNLKAAVIRADWYDPELNPKIESFCLHYGTAMMPTLPRRPEHKGKVESGVKYAKENALRGRTFPSLAEANRHLRQWEEQVADGRIHGTTRRQVRQCFEELERPALLPLPRDMFPCFREGQRKVHRDSYVEVDKAYYEVPAEHIGQQVWARWDGRTVRIYDRNMRQIALCAAQPPGTFSSALHARGRRSSSVEQDKGYWLHRAHTLGDHCGLWALEVMCERGAPAIRVVQGLVHMAGRHAAPEIDRACGRALSHGAYRLSDLRRLLAQPDEQTAMPFIQEHPLIRKMGEYAAFMEMLTENINRQPHQEACNE
ncbi:MAG: IS21 family transposase [Wenzhouxiangella sp.]